MIDYGNVQYWTEPCNEENFLRSADLCLRCNGARIYSPDRISGYLDGIHYNSCYHMKLGLKQSDKLSSKESDFWWNELLVHEKKLLLYKFYEDLKDFGLK